MKKGSPENPKNIEQKKEIAASPPIYILKFLSIKRAIWVKLFTQSKICEIKNSILGTGSMILGVFAEILQLLKRAATKHLSQKQKKPIDFLLLISNNRLHTIFLITELASWKNWIHPNTWGPITHGVFVIGYKASNFNELFFEIKLHLILMLTTLALHFTIDGNYFLGQQVVDSMHCSTVRCGPREGGRHSVTLPITWGLCWVTTST